MNRAMQATTLLTASALAAATMVVGGDAAATPHARQKSSHVVYVVATRIFGKTTGPVQFAGAIGDYGTGRYATADGKPDASGNYYLVSMRSGKVLVDLTNLNKKFRSSNPATYDTQTCSGVFRVSASASITGGTRDYKNATGTLSVSTLSEFVVPRFTSGARSGKCNFNAPPAHAITQFSAKGTVTV